MKKKLLVMVLVLMISLSIFAGCSQPQEETKDAPESTESIESTEVAEDVVESYGTILWLTYSSSSAVIETLQQYTEMMLDELGYDLKIVYGSPFNDPAENLNAVKNGMTKDVVGIMLSQHGGIKDIMAEYPDLFVVGTRSDLSSAFDANDPNSEVLTNDKFLGTICDGFADGSNKGKLYAEAVIEQGYKKVATMHFPGFAYPQLAVSDATFRSEIEAYNATVSAEEQIEIVGDARVLEFSPLDETFFLEEGNSDLDAIVASCAGLEFVYPTLKTAMINGTCSSDTKLITGGFVLEESVVADIGGDGVVQYISTSPTESIAWAIAMLDSAITGNMYSDFETPEQIDTRPYIIDSKEDIDNVMANSMKGSRDLALAQLTIEDLKSVLPRFNPDATYADLCELVSSDQMSVESLMDK